MAAARLATLSTWIGKVVASNGASRAAHVSVINMKLSERINVYYNVESLYWAADPELKCQIGDLVLIKQLSEPQTDLVRHEVKDIIFPIGRIIDPVTGRRCKGPNYLDVENRKFEKLDIVQSK